MAKPTALELPGPVFDPNNAATDGTTKHLHQGHFSPMNLWVSMQLCPYQLASFSYEGWSYKLGILYYDVSSIFQTQALNLNSHSQYNL